MIVLLARIVTTSLLGQQFSLRTECPCNTTDTKDSDVLELNSAHATNLNRLTLSHIDYNAILLLTAIQPTLS